jgi:tetratricopeptide (TPR) repeat protein
MGYIFKLESRMNISAEGRASHQDGELGYSREVVLLACILLLVILLGVTAFVNRMYRKKVHTLADDWFAQGEASYQAGNVAAALTDYRNALVYSPSNSKFQFHLAQALAAAGRGDEARSYLLSLLSESPGDGEINLALARISARQGAMVDALRFYHSAIYGGWENDPLGARWQVRRELCEYLLDHGLRSQAEAEVIGLANNTPPGDIDHLKLAGDFVLRAQLWGRALEVYRTVLQADPQDADALAGAGSAAFELSEYPQTLEYLDRLPSEKRTDPKIAEKIETSRQILDSDPFFSNLSVEEKAGRTTKALVQALSRLQECARQRGESLAQNPPDTDLQNLYTTGQEKQRDWSEHMLRLHPDRVNPAMSFVFQVENLAAQRCGEPQGEDRALWLLGRTSGGMVQ